MVLLVRILSAKPPGVDIPSSFTSLLLSGGDAAGVDLRHLKNVLVFCIIFESHSSVPVFDVVFFLFRCEGPG